MLTRYNIHLNVMTRSSKREGTFILKLLQMQLYFYIFGGFWVCLSTGLLNTERIQITILSVMLILSVRSCSYFGVCVSWEWNANYAFRISSLLLFDSECWTYPRDEETRIERDIVLPTDAEKSTDRSQNWQVTLKRGEISGRTSVEIRKYPSSEGGDRKKQQVASFVSL